MKKIPPALRAQMDADPWMHRCCITGTTAEKIDWHHVYTFGGSQINERWAIIPLARSIHDRLDTHLNETCEWIALNRATDDELRPYCKAINYIARRATLNRKFGYPLLKS